MNTFIVAILSILLSVAAQFALKAGMSSVAIKEAMQQPFNIQTVLTIFSNKAVLGGFLLYGIGAIVWLSVLSKWDVSKAYPLVGLGFAAAAIIGFIIGEHVTTIRLAGVTLICIGVFLVGQS